MKIRNANKSEAFKIASLHKIGIKTGFISSLPLSLIEKIYSLLIEKEIVLVAINEKESEHIIGFVSCSTNLKKFYFYFLIKYGLKIFFIILPSIFSFKFIKHMFEVLVIPFKNKKIKNKDIIPELLSIVVDENYKNQKIGSALLFALEKKLKENGFIYLKVIAGDELKAANNFYKKNDFKLKAKIKIHDNMISNLYVKEL